MSKLGLLLCFWEGRTRVHGAVLLLELHHFSGALPPFGAAVRSADLTAVLGLKSCPVPGGWELAGSVARGDPCAGGVTPRGSVPRVPAPWSGACRPQGFQGRRRPSCCWCSRTRLCAAELERGRSSCWQPPLRPTCIKCLSQSRTTLLQSFRFLEGWFLREKKKKKRTVVKVDILAHPPPLLPGLLSGSSGS